jgi:hypothetical protein
VLVRGIRLPRILLSLPFHLSKDITFLLSQLAVLALFHTIIDARSPLGVKLVRKH